MVSILNCPNCGRQVPPQEHFFCPYCAKPLNIKRHAKLPVASGFLTIIAALLTVVAGMLTINDALTTYGGYGYGFISGTNIFFWIAGIFEVIAFAIGLTGSIFQIRKRQLLMTIFGNVLLLVSVVILIGQSFFVMNTAFGPLQKINFILYAIPTLVLIVLSLVLIGISRKEFKN